MLNSSWPCLHLHRNMKTKKPFKANSNRFSSHWIPRKTFLLKLLKFKCWPCDKVEYEVMKQEAEMLSAWWPCIKTGRSELQPETRGTAGKFYSSFYKNFCICLCHAPPIPWLSKGGGVEKGKQSGWISCHCSFLTFDGNFSNSPIHCTHNSPLGERRRENKPQRTEVGQVTLCRTWRCPDDEGNGRCRREEKKASVLLWWQWGVYFTF